MEILVLIISLVHATSARFLVSDVVLKVVYGNIGSLRDLHLPPRDQRRSMPPPADHGDQHRLPDFDEFLLELEEIPMRLKLNSSTDFDMKDLNEVTKKLTDVKKNVKEVIKDTEQTRRQHTKMDMPPSEVEALYLYPARLKEWYYMKLSLTFLIHIRFHVDAAVRYKMASVGFKGYKVGYLFHKLTSIRNQMTRLMEEWIAMKTERFVQNRQNWRTRKHNLALLLRLYEQMLQLDVDMKDTVEMVKVVYFGRGVFQTQLATHTTPILHKK